MEFRILTIKVETILGETESTDKTFFEYLYEYSIEHKLTDELGEFGYPVVEYQGGPISLANMLREKFGMERDEIDQLYPQLNE